MDLRNPRTQRRRAAQRARTGEGTPHVSMGSMPIADLIPYANNPRDNESAIEAVKNSIQSFGFLVPIVVGDDNVIAAGHTRYAAAMRLGLTEVPVIRAAHLTEEQIAQFRLIDNKVSELASWDNDMLAEEITALQSSGVDFTQYGWTQEEVECLSEMVGNDCLSAMGEETEGMGTRSAAVVPRAPSQARMVLSEFVFFVPMDAYKRWAREVRTHNDFDKDAIIRDLQDRLGMTEYLESGRQ